MFYSNKKSQQWHSYIILILADYELDPFSRSGSEDGISVSIFLVKYPANCPQTVSVWAFIVLSYLIVSESMVNAL